MERQELEAWVNEARANNVEPSGELSELCKQAAELKLEAEALEAKFDAKKKALSEVQELILKNLELADVDSLRAHGFLFMKERRASVTTPKTIEAKKELFAYLEREGCFLEMVSVNSQTLNSLYKDRAAKALEGGVLQFEMPGVAKPTEYMNLKMKRG